MEVYYNMIQTLFVESLHRLYKDKRVDKEKIDELLSKEKINQQEYDYIISVDDEVKDEEGGVI